MSELDLTSDRLDALRKYAEDLESDGARSGTIKTDTLRALLDHVAKLDRSITRYALKISKSQTREQRVRANGAEARVTAVRELHKPISRKKIYLNDSETVCSECIEAWSSDHDNAPWPCPTINALDAE